MSRRLIFAALALLCAGAVSAQKRTEAPAASSEVRYVGRTQTKGGDVSFDWSGTSFECRFTGGSLAMRVSDTKKNYYNLTVDGRDAGVVTTFGTDSVVVLAEKLANELGVGVGDTVRLAEQDEMGNATDKTFDLTVTGVMENYIYNYVFIGPGEYARMEGGQPAFSTSYAVTSSDAGERAQFNDAVRAIDGVKTVAYNDEVIDAYKSMLKSVGLIVIVLVVAAAALAFIVLYNLTNINITERQREIATLKVLGFTPREVSAYIYRETMLLSVIGCAVGLVLGVFMEGFVVVTAEVDQVMFGRTIHAASFVIAFLLTMLFTVLVMLAMRRKLARVDMVESLKSNE